MIWTTALFTVLLATSLVHGDESPDAATPESCLAKLKVAMDKIVCKSTSCPTGERSANLANCSEGSASKCSNAKLKEYCCA